MEDTRCAYLPSLPARIKEPCRLAGCDNGPELRQAEARRQKRRRFMRPYRQDGDCYSRRRIYPDDMECWGPGPAVPWSDLAASSGPVPVDQRHRPIRLQSLRFMLSSSPVTQYRTHGVSCLYVSALVMLNDTRPHFLRRLVTRKNVLTFYDPEFFPSIVLDNLLWFGKWLRDGASDRLGAAINRVHP